MLSEKSLVKELRGVEEQIARELGQWPERFEVEDTSSADIMAKACNARLLSLLIELPREMERAAGELLFRP